MKRIFPAVFGCLLAFGSHSAMADGYAGGSAPAAGAWQDTRWGGLYIAGSIGYGIAKSDFGHTFRDGGAYDVTSSSDITSDGLTGTVALGYDVQLQSGLVAGIFADYTFGELDGSGIRSYPTAPTIERFSLEYDNTWAVGARLGIARTSGTLWYLTAGYTQTDLTLSDARGKLDEELKGYFIGGGVEHNIRDNLFLKLEYRYSDYGDETIYEDVGVSCGGTGCYERYDVESEIHAVRLGIAYKFGDRREAPAPLK